ncbi:DMT family transporter [Pelomonas sp. APW6]|uniref:DMT family transporter n=1 Tax=Roseateles subflavus TaxID=3053353 RepID=A0ABT7LKE3_9BURK|nr:DMT family transporter [Pelomonas sp. APW6]MDL5033337.1 DMT family transporter [Pelomonas sp. APW6]
MKHRRAVLLMVLVTLLWSTAGVVSRHLEAAKGFEVTFWRSAFNALSLVAALSWMRGAAFWRQLPRTPRAVWISGLCWSVMFTAFMMAITMTTVANVLVTMALGPLLTALFSRLFLHHRLPLRTWVAIVLGSVGIAWMFGHEMQGSAASLAGMGVALAVPLAAATNWTLLQRIAHADPALEKPDMLPAVLIGAVLSALMTLPMAWPFAATAHDLTLLAGLGLTQLAIPCLLVVRLTRVLPAPEVALLGLLEVIFGVLWAWWGAGEVPSSSALWGGAMVLAALVGNEWLGWRRAR